MENFTIAAVEGQQIVITLTLADKEGSPADLSAYSVYAASAGVMNPYTLAPVRKAWTVQANEDGTALTLTAPAVMLADGPWRYAIYIKQLATNLEWAAVGGKINLSPRTTEEAGGISPAAYAVQAETAVSGLVHCVLDSSAAALRPMVDAAQAAADTATTAASTATAAKSDVADLAAAATNSADRAAQQATQATTAATAAGSSATDAEAAKTAAQSARDTCVQSVATIGTTVSTHAASAATYNTLGHVKLGETVTAASAHAAKVTVDENGRLAVRKATASVVGCVKLGTGIEVASDAGMVGSCSNGGLAVRKASTNSTSGVGCVRLATSITDTGDVAVPTASLVQSALHGSTLEIHPVDSPSEGEWHGLLLPAAVLPHWPIRKITIPAFATAQTTPLYLAAYSSNGTTETRLGVSTTACTWEASGSASWEFTGDIIIPAGYQLRLYLITAKSDAAASSCNVIPGHVKSYYVPTGSCSVRYSGAWYGNRTPEINLASAPGHSSTAATASTPGHVYLATGADDARPAAVATAAQLAALEARVAALETA